jgi:hypothetical protein
VQDIDDSSKDIAATVRQQSGCLDVIHLGDGLVQLDETNSRLSASDRNKTFLDDSAVITLEPKLVTCRNYILTNSYLVIIDTDNNHRIRSHLLNSIEISHRINSLNRPEPSTPRTGPAVTPIL